MSAFAREDLLRTSRGANEVVGVGRYGRIVPDSEIEANLEALRLDVLEPAAAALGRGTLSSCYRSPRVNSAVGGAANSAHLVGLAADWVPDVRFDEAIKWFASAGLPLDRVIYEFRGGARWLHLQRLERGAPARTPLWYRSPKAGIYLAVANPQDLIG